MNVLDTFFLDLSKFCGGSGIIDLQLDLFCVNLIFFPLRVLFVQQLFVRTSSHPELNAKISFANIDRITISIQKIISENACITIIWGIW